MPVDLSDLPAAPLHRLAEIEQPVAALAAQLAEGGVLVLSGAGISTESGIPDYRGVTGRAQPATPMTIQEFTGSHSARQRYWARSHHGWRAIVRARPNAGHAAVARLQRAGLVTGVITQNVDGLHQAAGSHPVIELHGTLDRVVCLACGASSDRDELDARLQSANPGARDDLPRTPKAIVKPDGDVELSGDRVRAFQVVDCLDCGAGPLKPDVVFFGETVPAARVAACYDWVAASRLLLVLGSSLTVASGFRFVRRAVCLGIDVAIINDGPTRADGCARHRIAGPLGAVLGDLQDRLLAQRVAVGAPRHVTTQTDHYA